MWTWSDDKVMAADFETSGIKPEFALQPWRYTKGDMWVTSLAWVWPVGSSLKHAGDIKPSAEVVERCLMQAINEDRVIAGWHITYDISVFMALGFKDLCHRVRWLDGRLLWRHLVVEPERDEQPRPSYSLKMYVREKMPEHAGYEEDVNFHADDQASLVKLHEYNIRDCAFTLRGCKDLWAALSDRQRQAAWIEASCLPRVAEANLDGLLVDTIAAQDLMLQLKARTDGLLAELAPDGVTEAVVRSPKQLGELLFDRWGLPSAKKTATGNRAADKEVLYELAFQDPRCKKLRDYREALNCSKKFAETPAVAARYNGDGRAHPLAMVFGTYSGRFTYSSKQRNWKNREAEFPPRDINWQPRKPKVAPDYDSFIPSTQAVAEDDQIPF